MAPLLRKYYVNIDSSLRDRSVWPNADEYKLDFDETIYGISKIKVNYATIPNSEYLLNQDNRYLDFKIDGVTYTATMGDSDDFEGTDGRGGLNPTPLSYATELLVKTTAAYGSNVFTSIDYDGATEKYVYNPVASLPGGTLEFLFASGDNTAQSAARMMGFHDDLDVSYSVATSFRSPGLIQLNGVREVQLVLSSGGDKFTQVTSPSNTNQFNVTGRFPMEVEQGVFYTYGDGGGGTTFPIEYTFYEGDYFALNELKIEFYKTRNGNFQRVNFNGVNHIMQLEITAFTDRMMINKSYAFDKRLGLPKPVDNPLGEPVKRFDKNQRLIVYVTAGVLIVGLLLILLKSPKQSRHTSPGASQASSGKSSG